MVGSHCLTFNLGKPFVVNRLDNHPAMVVFDAKVCFVFDAFRLVFHNLTLTDDFVHVEACGIRSWVRWDKKSAATIGEGDVFGFINYHANMAMLSASILGCDTAGGIGEFLDQIHWLTIDFCDLVFFETLFDVVVYSHD